MTPKEVWCGSKPPLSHLHVFGHVTFVHVLKEAKTKLDSKGGKCMFINYYEETKGYKLYNPISQYVIISYDVIFNEFGNFNKEIMVSRLDFGSKYMVLNQKSNMEDEKFLDRYKKIQ
jgi:hypothetical protein